MSTVTRTAGVAGTFTYSLSQAPASAPVLTIFSNSARTVVAVPATALAATANPAVWTASYPATLPAGTYYLSFATVFTAGQPALVDADDTLVLTSPSGSVATSARARLEAMLQWTSEPVLTAAEVDELLALAQRADAEGRAPSDPSWVPTYDLDSAASEGWMRKAAKVVTHYSFSSDGQRVERRQVYEMCERQAEAFARRVVGSVPT